MEDRLEGNMKRFLDTQLSTIPSELTIAQVLDLPALQQTLQQTLQDSFEQQYRPLEGKIKREIEEMGKTAERKVGEIGTLLEGKRTELEGLKGKMRESQQSQTQFIGEIERIVCEKGNQMAQSYNQAREEISQMHDQVLKMDQDARNLYFEIEKRKMKAEIQGEIDTEGGDKVTFVLNNRKMYSLEGCLLQFSGSDGNTLYSGTIEPAVPGYQTAKVLAQLPDNFTPNIEYSVAVWRNNTVISNSVPFFV